MPKVSIIIPFNNVESYISECLDSVVNQTLHDIEIICIDDASEDKSSAIVKEYAKKDNRIKLIELKERQGQGYARNRGIEIATGEYIGFVDSDDFVKLEMFETMYETAKQNNTDITMCQSVEFDDITKQQISSEYCSLYPLVRFNDDIFGAEDSKDVILNINVALWNKIYKRSYLEEIGEKFPEGYIYEDLPFFFGSYMPAKKIKIVWKELYFYRVNRKNSTMQQFNIKILDRLPMVSLTYEKIKKVSYLDEYKKNIQAWIINDIFHRYVLLKDYNQKEYFFLMKKLFKSLEIEDISDKYWEDVYYFEEYLFVLENTFIDFQQRLFNKYLNWQKIKEYIFAKFSSSAEIDEKISVVYNEIEKNYKYTESLVQNLDKKTDDIYREITKNYGYTNELNENARLHTNAEISKVYSEVAKKQEIIDDLRTTYQLKSDKFANIFEQKMDNIRNDYANISSRLEILDSNFQKNSENIEKIEDDIDGINKVFEKIEKKVPNVNDNILNIKNDIEEKTKKIVSQTEDKIQKVYEEITKNYDFTKDLYEKSESYTQKSIKDLKGEAYPRIDKLETLYTSIDEIYKNISNVENSIQNATTSITAQQDEKILKFNNDINQIYEYTDSLINDRYNRVYNDVKDLSYIVNDNKDYILNKLNNLKNSFETEKHNEREKIKEVIIRINEELQKKIQNISNVQKKSIEDLNSDINLKVNKIVENIEQFKNKEKEYQETYKKLLEEQNEKFLELISELRRKHAEDINLMKEELIQAEIRLEEKIETPFKKFVEKYFKNSGK